MNIQYIKNINKKNDQQKIIIKYISIIRMSSIIREPSKIDERFMTLIPMVCYGCGRPLSNKVQMFTKMMEEGESFDSAMERMGIASDNYHCRMHFFSPINIPYGTSGKVIGSLAEYEVSPEINQTVSGVMTRSPYVKISNNTSTALLKGPSIKEMDDNDYREVEEKVIKVDAGKSELFATFTPASESFSNTFGNITTQSLASGIEEMMTGVNPAQYELTDIHMPFI